MRSCIVNISRFVQKEVMSLSKQSGRWRRVSFGAPVAQQREMPTCAAVVKVGWADGEGPLNKSPLGASTEHKKKYGLDFYADRSAKHPPKKRVPLLVREERFMAQLREERSTYGYSESFSVRRHFPIVPPPPGDSEESAGP